MMNDLDDVSDGEQIDTDVTDQETPQDVSLQPSPDAVEPVVMTSVPAVPQVAPDVSRENTELRAGLASLKSELQIVSSQLCGAIAGMNVMAVRLATNEYALIALSVEVQRTPNLDAPLTTSQLAQVDECANAHLAAFRVEYAKQLRAVVGWPGWGGSPAQMAVKIVADTFDKGTP